jgi:hypothetical protein
MTNLPNCLLIVTAEVDASVEADWNRWYDDVHLPDALACPGVLAGRRYLTAGEISESDRGQGRRTRARLYTTVYELDSPAAVETKEFAARRGWDRFAPHVRSQTRVVISVQG